MINQELHKIFVKRMSLEELKRKQRKARRKAYWTQEDIDLASDPRRHKEFGLGVVWE